MARVAADLRRWDIPTYITTLGRVRLWRSLYDRCQSIHRSTIIFTENGFKQEPLMLPWRHSGGKIANYYGMATVSQHKAGWNLHITSNV